MIFIIKIIIVIDRFVIFVILITLINEELIMISILIIIVIDRFVIFVILITLINEELIMISILIRIQSNKM